MPNDEVAAAPRVAQAAWVGRVLGVTPAQAVPGSASASMPAEGIPEATRSGTTKLRGDIDRLKAAAEKANDGALLQRIEALQSQVTQLKELAAGPTDGGASQGSASVAQVSPTDASASKPQNPVQLAATLRAAQAAYDRLRDDVRQSVAATSPPVPLIAPSTLGNHGRYAVASEKVSEIRACMRAANEKDQARRWNELDEEIGYSIDEINDPDNGEQFLRGFMKGLGGKIDETWKEWTKKAGMDAARAAIAELEEAAKPLAAIYPVNPATTLAIALSARLEKNAEQALDIARTASGQKYAVPAAVDEKKRLDKLLFELGVQINYLADPAARDTLQKQLTAQKALARSVCGDCATIQDLTNRWKAMNNDGTLRADIDAARGAEVTTEAATKNATATLAALARMLPPKSPETAAFEQRLSTAGGDPGVLAKLNADLAARLKSACAAPEMDADELVAGVAADTPPAERDARYLAALEKKFGVVIEAPPGVTVGRLPNLFELLKKLPQGPFKGDATFTVTGKLTFAYDSTEGPSCYDAGKLNLNRMWESSRETAPYLDLDTASKEERVEYYTAVTLHEIGHAVDDRGSVMKGNGAGAAFGGWETPGIDAVAGVVYQKYFQSFAGQDKTRATQLLQLATELLKGKPPAKPADAQKPLGALIGDWDAIEATDAFAVCNAVSAGSVTQWRNPALSDAERTYHEPYAGTWVSYLTAERARARVSDYQWRAPGEWFAEVYTRYHLCPEDKQADRDNIAQKFPAAMKWIA